MTTRTYAYQTIDPERLSATDLIAAYDDAIEAPGVPPSIATAYALEIYQDGDRVGDVAQALLLHDTGNVESIGYIGVDRIGISWGANAEWGDCHGDRIETVIDEWLNDADAWDARN